MRIFPLALAAGLTVSAAARAAPLTLTGNFLEVGISDYGTFGSNGTTPPGILHDPAGTGNFAPGGIPNDYLTPGTPHDGYAVNSTQTGLRINDNSGGGGGAFGITSPTLLTGAAALGYANAATWSGGIAGALSITNRYFFNTGDEQIHVKTTITALENLTSLSFGRSEDPDPDVNRFGSFSSINTRGDSATAPEDLVSGAGPSTGLTIGILNESGATYAHNTGISGFCCNNDDPNNVLPGYGPLFPSTNNGDFGLQIAWQVGDLRAGSSAEIDYAYVFGTNQGDVSRPPPVPEPASLTLLLGGAAALGAVRRRASARRVG